VYVTTEEHATGRVVVHEEGPALSTLTRRSQHAPPQPRVAPPRNHAHTFVLIMSMFNGVIKYGDTLSQVQCTRNCMQTERNNEDLVRRLPVS
jgi:hypothetical protein